MQSVNKKGSIFTAIALSTVLSQSVLAYEPATPINTVTSSDLSYAFDQSDGPVQVVALSDQEMRETEGAVGVGGALIGGGIYFGSTIGRSVDLGSNWGFNSNTLNNFRNNWSNSDFGFAVGAGIVGGAYGQALFRGVGYTGMWNQFKAPISVQVPIRSGSFGAGFTTFGVHGYPSTNFNNNLNNCGACYRAGQ